MRVWRRVKKDPKTVCISGLMLRTEEDRIVVELEIDGAWVVVLSEWIGSTDVIISHIIEPLGIIQRVELWRVGVPKGGLTSERKIPFTDNF